MKLPFRPTFSASRSLLLLTLVLLIVATFSVYEYYDSDNDDIDLFVQPNGLGDGMPTIPTDLEVPELHTIKDIVLGNPNFEGIENLLLKYGALSYLDELEAVTLFLPVGERFDRTTTNFIHNEYLRKGPNGIIELLNGHISENAYSEAGFVTGLGKAGHFVLKTLNGDSLVLTSAKGNFKLSSEQNRQSKFLIMDQVAVNGVIFGIDNWLIPSDKTIDSDASDVTNQ